jgi:hypothetical protein
MYTIHYRCTSVPALSLYISIESNSTTLKAENNSEFMNYLAVYLREVYLTQGMKFTLTWLGKAIIITVL